MSINTQKNKKSISDVKIIELYNMGWSINDIVAHYKTGVHYVRLVLNNQGIATSQYRSASSFLKDCLFNMIKTGIPFRKISDIIDISTHLMRDVLRQKNINASLLRDTELITEINYSISDDVWAKFYELYLKGECGFFKCVKLCELSVDDSVECLYRLNDKDVEIHKDKLYSCILSCSTKKLSHSSIAKQFDVSPSIVKQIWNTKNDKAS